VSREVWKIVVAQIGKVGVAEAEGRNRKETRRKEAEREKENNGSKTGSGEMEDLERGRGSSKVGSRSKEVNSRKVSQVDSDLQQEGK